MIGGQYHTVAPRPVKPSFLPPCRCCILRRPAVAAASAPAGRVSEWTARLPSALAATAVVLLFYAAFARALGPGAGLAAALTQPACLLWLDRVPSAEIDMLQLAWVSAALLCFLRALQREEAREGEGPAAGACGWWCLAMPCVAGGVLAKWT